MHITIEPATPTDAEGISKLIHETLLEGFASENEEITNDDALFLFNRNFTPENVRGRLLSDTKKNTHFNLIAKNNTEIIAIIRGE